MSQGLKDFGEIAIGFLSALAMGGAFVMIVLGVFGYFDQGTKYKYPQGMERSR